MSDQDLKRMADSLGVERLRINEEITASARRLAYDAYGKISNTNETGWYFAGFQNEIDHQIDRREL